MALNVAYGSYTGDGTDNRNITVSPSFAIKFVLIKTTTADTYPPGTGAWFSISGMGDGAVPGWQNDVIAANIIQSMGTGTFQIGYTAAGHTQNNTGKTYYYTAIGGDSTEVAVGSYSGNATDNRAITGIGFLPGIVFIAGTGNNTKVARFGNTGDSAHYLANAADVANVIQSLDADGFTVGTSASVNTSAETYYWLAIKEVTGSSKASSYTGDGGSSRAITGLGFQPDLVFVKGQSTQFPVFRTPTNSGDNTSATEYNIANFAGGVKSLDSDGFTLGADSRVNTNSSVYSYYAIKNATVVANTGAGFFAMMN